MHDSSRDAEKLRDAWATLAEEEGVVVLSPHFPCDLKFPDGPDNYKRLAWETGAGEELRYDSVLLDMIDCVADEWGCVDTRTFALVGFSGGGQFVHRFLYLYPERVHAVSIGAPGRATPLVDEPWPQGIRGAPTTVQRRWGVPLPNAPESDEPEIPAGRAISVPALAERTRAGAVAVQLLIGSEDTWRPVQPDGSRAAHSRFEATQAVAKSWDDAGIVYDFTVVPGVKHEGEKIREVAMPWVRRYVRPSGRDGRG
jgi:pimeloyl-ACP methyl ester carboxylesterase